MTNLFLYGTLLHPELLELVAGRAQADLAPEAARLRGHRVVWAKGHGFPLITAEQNGVAQGAMLRGLDGTTLERLNYYELGFGYELHNVMVETGFGAEAAQVYFPKPGLWQPGAPFSLADWVAEHWPLTRHAATEVMSCFGHLSGAEMARRYRMIETRAVSALLAERDAAPHTLRSDLSRETVREHGAELSHAGFFLLKTLHLSHPRFDGTMSEEVTREVFVAGDAATVLPYDPVRDRVMLIEQFRMGPYGRGDRHPWMLEPVAGRIDGGESAQSSARREAQEEAGLEISRLEPIARYYGTPGYSTEMFHSFIGIADLPDRAAGQGGLPDEHEDIRSHVISFDHAMRLVDTGEANNGPLILSLLWLARERARLRAG